MGYQVYEDAAAAALGVRRWAGYGVPAICDQPNCDEEIDRGLASRCGEPDGYGCGLSFCSSHLYFDWSEEPYTQRCVQCSRIGIEPFIPKPDTAEWVQHMLTDESWSTWRAENPEWVKANG